MAHSMNQQRSFSKDRWTGTRLISTLTAGQGWTAFKSAFNINGSKVQMMLYSLELHD